MLKLNGRQYQVQIRPSKHNILPYTLVGKRGATYTMVRNQKNPQMLAVVICGETFWLKEVDVLKAIEVK